MTEQYIRPKTQVSATSNTMTPTFSASRAGRNWMRAIHPSQVCKVPVKSMNSSVISARLMMARVSLIVRNIVSLLL